MSTNYLLLRDLELTHSIRNFLSSLMIKQHPEEFWNKKAIKEHTC